VLIAACNAKAYHPPRADAHDAGNHRANDSGGDTGATDGGGNDGGGNANNSPGHEPDGPNDAGGVTSGPGNDGGGNANGVTLLFLSLREAPAPTRTFFWGEVNLTAPGFVGPPRDSLTIALDAENHLRYLSWKTLPHIPKRFGDDPTDFPLTRTKRVEVNPNVILDATVEEAPEPTASHFLFRMRNVSTDGLSDYVESIEGTRSGDGWSVVYSKQGTYFGPVIDAHAAGTLYAGDPGATPSDEGSLWSAPVELVAPGFNGPPVDHMTVSLDAQGQLRSFGFERFVRKQVTFGTRSDDLPLSGVATRGDLMITVDDAVAPTETHFVLRYHVTGNSGLTDFIEGLGGARAFRSRTRQRPTLSGQRTPQDRVSMAPINEVGVGCQPLTREHGGRRE
jgi:hypothetical protein